MSRRVIPLASLVAVSALNVQAAVIKIAATTLPSPHFAPDSVQIAAGDTLRWMREAGDHTATSGAGVEDPQAGMDYNAPLTAATPAFNFQFSTPGSYSNFCIPHGDPDFGNMKGKVVVTPPVDEYVSTTAQLFTEDSVQIEPGETIEFYNGDGNHTLTSGTGALDPNSGDFFDGIVGTSFPAIQLTFDIAGVYPFYCTPHEQNGMFTTVYIVEPLTCVCPCKYDPECDGVTTVLDVSRVINVAFRGIAAVVDPNCPRERSDIDASGVTNVLDVTKTINVAFRGQAIAANFVEPCP